MADIELETPDPIAALDDKSISVRAAACRDLSKVGTVADLARLAVAAQTDKSPAVRLGTSAAASDILSRLRMSPQNEALDADGRSEVLELFKRVDPRHNPGVFSVFACLDTDRGFRRLQVGLRDPRGEVRLGAAVGLMRLCTSWVRAHDGELVEAVNAILGDRRVRPDALAEVARVCMASGFTGSLTPLERLDIGGVHQELVDEAISKLEAATERPVGVWLSDGRDAGEVRPDALHPVRLLVVADTGAAAVCEAGGGWSAVDLDAVAWRAMFYRRSGTQTPAPALQVDGTTYYALAEDALTEAVDTVLPSEGMTGRAAADGACSDAVRALADRLGDTSMDTRGRGLLWASMGDWQNARDAFEAAVGLPKRAPDLHYLYGAALAACGDAAGAKAAWTTAVEKARSKKKWFVAAANAGLSG